VNDLHSLRFGIGVSVIPRHCTRAISTGTTL
jgi:hypothetical protein